MQFQAITSALLAACLASAAAVPHAPRAEVRATLNLFKADNAGSSNCAGFPIQQTSVTEDCQNANRTLLGGQGDYYRANLLTVQEGWKVELYATDCPVPTGQQPIATLSAQGGCSFPFGAPIHSFRAVPA